MDPRRDQLIRDNLPLVEHVVRRVTGSFPSYIDQQELLAAGRLGLTEAASRYDFDRDIPFAAFAARRIRGAVMDVMRSNDWVPRKVRDTAREIDRVETKLHHQLGRRPEADEVAAAAGIGVDELRANHAAVTHGSVGTLDRPIDDTHTAPSEALVDPTVMDIEELLESRELHGYLRAALDNLPERLRVIVVGHYLEGKSVDELGRLLDVTPSRVSQLRADAIEIIRHGVESQFRPGVDEAPKGRVAIRQARYAAAIAQHADWRSRLLATNYLQHRGSRSPGTPTHDRSTGIEGVDRSA